MALFPEVCVAPAALVKYTLLRVQSVLDATRCIWVHLPFLATSVAATIAVFR